MPDEYDQLFAQYVKALRDAKSLSEDWWERALSKEAARDEASSGLRRRWPLGPAAHPMVIAVYRDFYLNCELITQRRTESEDSDARVVDPASFVTEWLLGDENGDLALLISQLPYAPMGLDDDGNTV